MLEWIDGCNIQNGIIYVCTNPEDYESNKFTDPYTKVGYTYLNMTDSYASGYITKMGYDPEHPYCNLPYKSEGGSTSTYYCDFSYVRNGYTGLYVGGSDSNLNSGLSYWYAYNQPSYSASNLGCRLSYKPV